MDTNESVNHLPSRKRAGSKDDYRALLDSTEQKQQYDYVRRTPFGVVSLSILQATKPQLIGQLACHSIESRPVCLRWLCCKERA